MAYVCIVLKLGPSDNETNLLWVNTSQLQYNNISWPHRCSFVIRCCYTLCKSKLHCWFHHINTTDCTFSLQESLSWMPTTSDISLTSVWLQSTLHIKLKPATGDGICKLFKIVSKLQKLMLDTIAPCVQVTFQSIMSTYKINTLRCTVPIRPNRK